MLRGDWWQWKPDSILIMILLNHFQSGSLSTAFQKCAGGRTELLKKQLWSSVAGAINYCWVLWFCRNIWIHVRFRYAFYIINWNNLVWAKWYDILDDLIRATCCNVWPRYLLVGSNWGNIMDDPKDQICHTKYNKLQSHTYIFTWNIQLNLIDIDILSSHAVKAVFLCAELFW